MKPDSLCNWEQITLCITGKNKDILETQSGYETVETQTLKIWKLPQKSHAGGRKGHQPERELV